MIKNIIFDIGNIITEGTPDSILKYIVLDEKNKKIIKEKIFNSSKWIDLDLGKDNFDTYFEKIKKDLPYDIRMQAHEILKNYPEKRKFNKEILLLIEKLSHNYKIYILSDNNIDTYNYLKTTNLNNYISGWCVSSVYHELKKDKKLFEILFTENKISPNECYFIDDKLENIEIGKEFGMQGFVLDWKKNKFNDLITDMKQNNIKI